MEEEFTLINLFHSLASFDETHIIFKLGGRNIPQIAGGEYDFRYGTIPFSKKEKRDRIVAALSKSV